MMPRRNTRFLPLGLLGLLAGCATQAPPPRVAAPPPPPPVLAPPTPAPVDWADLPITPGRWVYAGDTQGSSARYGDAFAIRCLPATHQVTLARTGGGTTLSVKTSYGVRTLAAAGGVATLAAGDPLLDQIAFSRARVSIESAGVPLLMMPAWAEPARVIEDCRIGTP